MKPIVTRGISVQEPWAWAIVAGHKPIENRTWSTPYRGPVAIQASTSKRAITGEADNILENAGPKVWAQIDDERIGKDNQILHFGAIVGVVDIVGCFLYDATESNGDFEAQCRAAGYGDWLAKHTRPDCAPPGYWADGGYCLLLDNPRQFTQPFPAKGRLNIYRLNPAEVAAVSRALSAPLGSPVEYRAKLAAAGKAAKSAKQISKPSGPGKPSPRQPAAAK